MKKIFTLLIFSLTLFAKPTVSVSILPQEYFVKKIAHELVDVNVMVQPGFSPHVYEPKPSQMKALAKSDIYFAIGVNFEDSWLDKFASASAKMKIVHTDDGIEKIEIEEHGHDHAHNHNHDEELDPHIWLDPNLVKLQAKSIFEALIKEYPQYINEFTRNYNEFLDELTLLDEQILKTLASLKNRKFMVFHPSWGYFAKRYNLEMISIEVSGKEPKPRELGKILKNAKENNIKTIFVSENFSKKSAEALAKELGANVVSINELSNDWANELLKTARVIK